MKIKRMFFRFQVYAMTLIKLFFDKNTPIISKAIIIGALIYILWPVDLIPDFIPFAGLVDEIIIIPLLIYAAMYFIPKDLKNKYKKKTEKKLIDVDEAIEGEIVD